MPGAPRGSPAAHARFRGRRDIPSRDGAGGLPPASGCRKVDAHGRVPPPTTVRSTGSYAAVPGRGLPVASVRVTGFSGPATCPPGARAASDHASFTARTGRASDSVLTPCGSPIILARADDYLSAGRGSMRARSLRLDRFRPGLGGSVSSDLVFAFWGLASPFFPHPAPHGVHP